PEIGDWVLQTACREAALMAECIDIAINVSPLQFDGTLSRRVEAALDASGLAPERLQLEVTETVFMRSAARTAAELDRLSSLGVSLVIDDFGTGYSSLGYLQRAKFSKIKIDRSFVTKAADGCPHSIAIIHAIVALCDSLGMTTTAEGVENEHEAKMLHQFGCTTLQGYLFGTPAPLSDHGIGGHVPLLADWRTSTEVRRYVA
ncbi:MAG: EAL domain-containing protein, partial [Pseudomonadota bacterium]